MSAFSLVSTPHSVSVLLQRTDNALLPLSYVETYDNPWLRYTVYRQSFSARHRSMSQLLRTV